MTSVAMISSRKGCQSVWLLWVWKLCWCVCVLGVRGYSISQQMELDFTVGEASHSIQKKRNVFFFKIRWNRFQLAVIILVLCCLVLNDDVSMSVCFGVVSILYWTILTIIFSMECLQWRTRKVNRMRCFY